MTPLLKCHCGRKPKLEKCPIDLSVKVFSLRYQCPNCKVPTFGAGNIDCAIELWNGFLKYGKPKIT